MSDMKNENMFKRYFANFGLKQICDLAMIVAALVLIAGLFTAIGSVTAANIIILVGLAMYAISSCLAVFLSVRVLLSKINKRSPEYKRAIVNIVIMGVLFALSVFGVIWISVVII